MGLLAAVALLVAGQPVLAAPQWLPPVPAFSAANRTPDVAMGPDGTLAIAYTVPPAGQDPLTPGGDVQVRIRPPGGEFGPPTTLASDASIAGIAVGRGGHVAIVWRRGSSHYAAVRPPGGTFGPAHEVSPDGGFADIRSLAVAPDGRVWMVRGNFTQDVVTLGPDGAVTHLPLDTGPAFTNTAPPSLAVDGEGRVTVIYRHTTYVPGVAFDDPCHVDYEIRVAERGAGGFTDVATLARTTQSGTMLTTCRDDGVEPLAPEVAVRPSGDAVVTYALDERVDYSREVETRILARFRPAGGTWPEAASSPELIVAKPFAPTATPAFAGATPVVLLEDTLLRDVSLAARSGNGSWSAPQLLSGDAMQAVIAGSPAGNALIAYIDLLTARATGVARAPDGGFSAAAPLSAPFNGWIPLIASLSLTVDDDGNGAVASGEPGHQPWLAPYDGAGPHISATFPAGGSIRQSLPFEATAVDVWTGNATLAWAFGDSETADGAFAAHAYDGPGRFTATVTATDMYGNEATRVGTVAIIDDTAPRFRGRASVRPRRVRRGSATMLRFALSELATVRTTLTARLPGVRQGRRCVPPRRRAHADAKPHCRRTVQRRLRARRFAAGAHQVRLATRLLSRGRYTLVLTAQDLSGNLSRAVRLTLIVLPRRR